MSQPTLKLDDLACQLEESGNYKVLRRLIPRQPAPAPANYEGKFGIMLDFETTGLDTAHDEVIEVAMVKFRYSAPHEITGIDGTFQAFNKPKKPIPTEITTLTGITNDMVSGRKIDMQALEAFLTNTHVIVAHNAAFDRKFAERMSSIFEQKSWACSATEIPWRRHGFDGARLGYLLAGAGFFHDAHRALDDCQALVEILSQPLPNTDGSAFAALMKSASRTTTRVWAERSPFELKDVMKRRGYRWSDGSDGRPRSWYIDVDEDVRDAELNYLRREIYQRNVDILCRELTARERFSSRA
jgi:DNA polymerase-3 subunit epsilon